MVRSPAEGVFCPGRVSPSPCFNRKPYVNNTWGTIISGVVRQSLSNNAK